MERNLIATWLVHWADPNGPRTPPPGRPLDADQFRRLFVLAEMHGVLALILRNAAPVIEDSARAAAWSEALARHHAAIGLSLVLQQHGNAVMAAATSAGIPAIIVKGPVFARRLYPERALRQFTDVDILTEESAVARLAEILAAKGFRLSEGQSVAVPREWRWSHRERRQVAIEVQTDLIHAASLRGAMSVGHADLVPGLNASEAERPAALLTVAVVHGGAHHFRRLLHVTDILQGARLLRGTEEETRLEKLVARTGARFAAVVGLDLAGRLFSDARCFEIAKALGPVARQRIARLLIDRSVVVPPMDRSKPFSTWRRAAFRELLKRGGAPMR